MERSCLLISPLIRMPDKVVSRPLEHQREPPTPMRKQLVAAHPDGEVVVHQIRTRMVMEELPHLPGRRIHLVVTVAKLPPGTRRRARPTHIKMVAKHQLGTPLHERLIRTKTETKPLHGMRHRGLLTHTETASHPRPGVTMGAEHHVGAEDGGPVLRITMHMAARHLHGQPTQATRRG